MPAEPPDDEDDLGEAEDPALERLPLEARPPEEPADEPDGARTDDPPDDDRPDGAPRRDGDGAYGTPEPMLRLGRIGEVRGTMTGRDELTEEPGRPPPVYGATGCRTKGEEGEGLLGRADDDRVLGSVE